MDKNKSLIIGGILVLVGLIINGVLTYYRLNKGF